MTFDEIESKIFFDTLKDLGIDSWLPRTDIVERVATRITVNRANYLFDKYIETGNKFLDDREGLVFKISDAGKVYYSYLTNKYDKAELDKKLVSTSIDTNKWMKIFTGILAGAALLTFILQIVSSIEPKDNKQSQIQQQGCRKHLPIGKTLFHDTLNMSVVVHSTENKDTFEKK
jgi:hypothetical protein